MLRIELKPCPDRGPGHGQMYIHGWNHDADGMELTVQRNQDGHFLGAEGRQWGSTPVWHALTEFTEQADVVTGTVGSWLIDALVANPAMTFRLQLRGQPNTSGSTPTATMLRVIGTLLSSHAAGTSLNEEQRSKSQSTLMFAGGADSESMEVEDKQELSPPPQEPPPVMLMEDPPVPATEPPPPPPPRGKGIGVWVALLLLAMMVASSVWWFWLRVPSDSNIASSLQANVVLPGGQVETGDDAAMQPCGAQALAQTPDDLGYIQSCLHTSPSSQEILAVIETARTSGRCGVMQRLYANRAQSGDAAIAIAYAREYDPESHRGGCVQDPDEETALYWYEVALSNQPDNQQVQQRVEALKQ